MKVTIDGHHFDTKKVSYYYDLYYFDGNNQHTGTVYCSSKGTWYVWTPSQWANQHSWRLISSAEILEEYDRYLGPEEKEEIAKLSGIDWE